MYRIFCVHKYVWKFLGPVQANSFDEAVVLAKAKWGEIELRVSDGENVIGA